jgi:VIT1/CCC1 family predicted Fe2+/Mn2+ transporter
MSDDTVDILIASLGLAWLVSLAIFGASRTSASGTASGPARVWPWVVGVPAVLILSCLAYFLFGRP